MSRAISAPKLRRKAIEALEQAITLATAAGDYVKMARYANQLATIARQQELATQVRIARSHSRTSKSPDPDVGSSDSGAVVIET